MDIKTIAAVGDSISNGYCDPHGGWLIRLLQTLNKSGDTFYSLNNFAISGDTLGDAWHNLCRNCIHRQTDTLILYIGANDIRRKSSIENEMATSQELRACYWDQIIDLAARLPQKTIVFGLLPVDEGKGAYECEDGIWFWQNTDVQSYNAFIRDRLQGTDIQFIDWHDDFTKNTPLPDLMEDIVHPNAEGHQRMAEMAYQVMIEPGEPA